MKIALFDGDVGVVVVDDTTIGVDFDVDVS